MGEIKIIDHLSPVGTETGTELGNNYRYINPNIIPSQTIFTNLRT